MAKRFTDRAGLPKNSFDAIENRRRIFWSLTDTTYENDCWSWIGPKGSHGYGRFCWNGTSNTAHRFAYEQSFGPIPKGLFACHHCDNPLCVNPIHLFAGTEADNNLDMRLKGRGSAPPDTARKPGEGNPMHKLTDTDIQEIRRRRAAGEKGRYLAKVFNVDPSTICSIHKGRSWTHVYAP